MAIPMLYIISNIYFDLLKHNNDDVCQCIIHLEHKKLDILVNNAGVLVPSPELTTDRFEPTMGVNHLGEK